MTHNAKFHLPAPTAARPERKALMRWSTVVRRFWLAVHQYYYRKVAMLYPRKTAGLPGNRDPESPCEVYAPRPQHPTDWLDGCQGDGHWLCAECCHLTADDAEEERWTKEQQAKCGDYKNGEAGCPNCGRHRVMRGDDGKRRCEKCAWCIEDASYDSDLGQFLR